MDDRDLSPEQFMRLPLAAPGQRVPYGPDAEQFGHLRVPAGAGPFPLAVLIHGGCWQAAVDLRHMDRVAEDLAGRGVATWSLEYRRVGSPGGGWPATFTDVAAGLDAVRALPTDAVDLRRVVVVGHSAGGHLALWLAARRGPFMPAGVLALAAIADLQEGARAGLCRRVVPRLLGADPAAAPERLRQASPVHMSPPGVPVRLVTAGRDAVVPAQQAVNYLQMAGPMASRVDVADAGHFELVVPGSPAWPVVLGELLRLFDSAA